MSDPNLPVWLQNAPPSSMAETAATNLGGSASPYLSIMGNRLTLIDAAGDDLPVTTVDQRTGMPYLDCCIIDIAPHPSKVYYAKAFDPSAQSWSPPDCWSDNGIGPSVSCSAPQARSCAPDPEGVTGCRWSVWGSATSRVSGKGIPACSKQQKVALIVPGNDVVFLLRVPPNSLDNLRTFMARFKGQPIGPEGVLTRISFEPGVLGTLNFVAVSYVDQQTWELRAKAIAAKATDDMLGRHDRPTSSVQAVAPPVAQGQIAGPQAGFTPTPAYVPSPAFPSTPAAPPAASPSEPAPPRRGRKRNAAAQEAPGVPDGVAPFAPNPAPAAPVQNGPAQGSFGISPGVAPDPAMQSMLGTVFGK